MAAAQRVDARVQHGEDPGRLAGVPLAVKDLIDQAGLVNTAGSSFYRETPDETAVALRRLEQQGAIPIGRTGLHESALGFGGRGGGRARSGRAGHGHRWIGSGSRRAVRRRRAESDAWPHSDFRGIPACPLAGHGWPYQPIGLRRRGSV